MPFTAFHLGPGLAIKAVAGRRVSLLTFGMAQVAMDVEPLVGMIRGSAVLHGPTHTYLAAVPIALLVAIAAPLLCRPILGRWRRELSSHGLGWLDSGDSWSRGAVLAGAFLGTFSHVVLDSIMHADMAPFAPFPVANDLLGVATIETLEMACLAAGAAGLLAWVAVRRRARQEN